MEDAFLYEKRIDSTSYERQRDKVREEIGFARIELGEARIDEIDVEGLLGFAEHVLGNAARMWMDATAEQKQKLQAVFFLEGLRLKDGRFGTAVTCLAFKQMSGSEGSEIGMASPRGTDTQWTIDFYRKFRAV